MTAKARMSQPAAFRELGYFNTYLQSIKIKYYKLTFCPWLLSLKTTAMGRGGIVWHQGRCGVGCAYIVIIIMLSRVIKILNEKQNKTNLHLPPTPLSTTTVAGCQEH